MILGRTGGGIVDQIVAEAQAAGVPLQSDLRLAPGGVSALATAFHLNTVPPSPGIIAGQEVVDRLSSGACGLFGQEAAGKHVVACHGMIGDFSSSSTCTILGVDPRGFTAINMSFFDFQNQFSITDIMYK